MDIIHGIRIGQFDFDVDSVISEIKWRCIDNGMNYVAFSPGEKDFCGYKNEYKEKKNLFV